MGGFLVTAFLDKRYLAGYTLGSILIVIIESVEFTVTPLTTYEGVMVISLTYFSRKIRNTI